MPKRCKPIEIALACKAYITATLDPVKDADQDFVVFSTDFIEKMTVISPPNYATTTERGIGQTIHCEKSVSAIYFLFTNDESCRKVKKLH